MQFDLNPVGGFDQLGSYFVFRWTSCASPGVAHLHWLLQIEKKKIAKDHNPAHRIYCVRTICEIHQCAVTQY